MALGVVCVGVLFVGSVGLHARWLGGDMVCVSVRTNLPSTGGRCDVRHMAWCYGPGWMRGWMDAWRDWLTNWLMDVLTD